MNFILMWIEYNYIKSYTYIIYTIIQIKIIFIINIIQILFLSL